MLHHSGGDSDSQKSALRTAACATLPSPCHQPDTGSRSSSSSSRVTYCHRLRLTGPIVANVCNTGDTGHTKYKKSVVDKRWYVIKKMVEAQFHEVEGDSAADP